MDSAAGRHGTPVIGHIRPNLCRLPPDVGAAYRGIYCGLCAALRGGFGLPAAFFVNHELSYVLLALLPYSAAAETRASCPARLYLRSRPCLRHALIERAASLCLLPVWLKLVDLESDRPARYWRYLRSLLQTRVDKILPTLEPNARETVRAYLHL